MIILQGTDSTDASHRREAREGWAADLLVPDGAMYVSKVRVLSSRTFSHDDGYRTEKIERGKREEDEGRGDQSDKQSVFRPLRTHECSERVGAPPGQATVAS